MRSRGVFGVQPCPFGDGFGSGHCESGAGEDPRTIRQRMDGFDLAGFSGQPKRLGRDLQELCGVVARDMVVCTENLYPNVLTMKSAQYGARIYDAGSLNLATDRRIFVQ